MKLRQSLLQKLTAHCGQNEGQGGGHKEYLVRTDEVLVLVSNEVLKPEGNNLYHRQDLMLGAKGNAMQLQRQPLACTHLIIEPLTVFKQVRVSFAQAAVPIAQHLVINGWHVTQESREGHCLQKIRDS
eukprot:scaffold110761_cov22-Tisochrysis_lutea.AAC.1